MEVANLSDVKDDLSRYVQRARRGERIRILLRGVAVADLVPIDRTSPIDSSVENELNDLEQRGIVRRGSGKFPKELSHPGPRLKKGSAVQTLLEQRRSGR